MKSALNMTMKLKQDEKSQKALAALVENFGKVVQPAIEQALRNSKIVHYARVVVIDNKYMQILTEYDGDKKQYTEFFRVNLQKVFEQIFSLVEGALPWEQLNNRDTFYEESRKLNVRALGTNPDDDKEGWLFDAFNGKSVRDIQATLNATAAPGTPGNP
jgi:hypothetical protein